MFFQSIPLCRAGIHAPWLFRFDPARALLEDIDSGLLPDSLVRELSGESRDLLIRDLMNAEGTSVELVQQISVPTLLREFPKLRDVSFIKVRGCIALR